VLLTPIVHPPQEAFYPFTRSGMDVLVLGDHMIEKTAGMKSWS
jgi:predicted NodU family carbamoyl transferase